MSSVAPALAPTNIISIILNSSQHQAVTLPKQIVRTCASCCVQQAQPFRVLGRNAPAQPSGSAQRPSPGTASASLLGSVPRPPGGIAASGPVPGFILGCGPSRPASRHPVRNTHRQPQTNHNRKSKIPGFRQIRMPIFRQSRVPGFRKSRVPGSGISSSSSKRPKSVPKTQFRPVTNCHRIRKFFTLP